MYERKLTKVSEEKHERVTYLQQKLDSITEDNKKKEKEFDETLDAMQNDIDQLEAEKSELKERIQAQQKRSVFQDLGMRRPTVTQPPQQMGDSADQMRDDVLDSREYPVLKQQISTLRAALREESKLKMKLIGEKMCRELDSLPDFGVEELMEVKHSKEPHQSQ